MCALLGIFTFLFLCNLDKLTNKYKKWLNLLLGAFGRKVAKFSNKIGKLATQKAVCGCLEMKEMIIQS